MKPSPLNPTLIGAVVLVLGICGWFGYQWFAAQKAMAAERDRILLGIAVELRRSPLDTAELSRLMAAIKKLEDHATAPDLLAAQARVELARGRPERAGDLFLKVAARPGAAAEDQGLAAEILLRQHASGLSDRSAAVAMLEEVMTYSGNAYAASEDDADLMRSWLAALRLADKDRSKEFADRILDRHPGSPAAAFVGVVRAFSTAMPPGELDAVRERFEPVPPELDAMAAVVALQAGNVKEALRLAEPLLTAAAGIVDARVTCLAVFHACALGSAAGSDD
ncbi:MAG: hypothetical protein KDC98_14330, partial [Planctomycetes bacterium]|nr:hypothetical protein [Planctomycetota bacterium]